MPTGNQQAEGNVQERSTLAQNSQWSYQKKAQGCWQLWGISSPNVCLHRQTYDKEAKQVQQISCSEKGMQLTTSRKTGCTRQATRIGKSCDACGGRFLLWSKWWSILPVMVWWLLKCRDISFSSLFAIETLCVFLVAFLCNFVWILSWVRSIA